MKRKLVYLLPLLLLPITFSSHATPFNAGTTYIWKNQYGSTLTENILPGGKITGTFVTAVGCGVGIPRDVVGNINKDAMSFVVDFKECNYLAAWNGYISSNGKNVQMDSLWTLKSTVNSDFGSTMIGHDTFILQK